MTIILRAITILLQLAAGQFLGFGLAYAGQVGGGWELVAIPAGNTLGVWGVGAVATWLRGQRRRDVALWSLLGAAAGSALGIAVILLTPATGFTQVLYPLLGALLGYYVGARLAARPDSGPASAV